MKNEWKNIDETIRNRLEEALDQREMNSMPYSQEWFEEGQIDEVAFCENFLQSGTLPVSEAISLDCQESEMGEEADSGQPLLLGIDIGTTSIVAQVIAADTGKSIQTYSFDHHAGLLLPEYPDAYAADASRLLERAVALTDSLIRTYPSIVSIGITGQMHGIVCVGHEGEILSPLYTWQNAFGLRQVSHADPRTYCQKIFDCCGERIPTGYGLVTCYALEQLDMFPTILSYMGFEIPGDRLGMGTDLFSRTPTLVEALGYDYLSTELQKQSVFYRDNFY